MEENLTLMEESSPVTEETEITPEENSQPEAKDTSVDDAKERNLEILRKARKKAERERDEYLQKLKQLEENAKKTEVQEENIDPSDLVEWRHVQKEIGKLKQELNTYKQQTSTQTMESKLKSQYPDIEKVLTQDNIDRLRESDPELAQMINENQNLYTKASVAYKYIKKMGIYSDKSYDKEKEAIAANSSKPLSSAAVSKSSALSNASDFMERDTEQYRKKLYQEMVAAARRT